MTYYEAAMAARAALVGAGLLPETAALDADLLARHVAGWDLPTWITRRGDTADDRFLTAYEQAIARRVDREPVAYIRGVQEFWGRDFAVTPDVLIPRPETELLIECAASFLKRRRKAAIVDVGTGSGCLAITIALEHPSTIVHATDVSAEALAVARANAARLGAADRVTFVLGSGLANVPRPIDCIISNPPYVAERDRPGLPPEVRDHEPPIALFGGEDGWREIRRILAEASDALAPDGLMLIELGYNQSEDLPREMSAWPALRLERIAPDLQGIPRVAVVARR